MENAPMIFDSHAHYCDERYSGIRDEILSALPAENVCAVVNCGTTAADSVSVLELAEKYKHLYAAVGIHPQEVAADTEFDAAFFEKLICNKKVVAIGEIGLDYYWDATFKHKQKQIFKEQIEFALKNDLPIIVHDREAHADTLEILKEYRPHGVVHCFSGSRQMAEELIGIGMYIGVGGVITFKNSKKLIEVVENTPIERILLETDAPYLAPEPFRGKINNSAYIKFIAQKIAEIKGMATWEVLEKTRDNANKFFKIL